MEIAQQMKIVRFKASEGWLTNFKQRHPTLFGKIPATNFVADQPEDVNEWQTTNSNELLVQFLGAIQNDSDEKTEEVTTEGYKEDPSEFEANGNEMEAERSGLDEPRVKGKLSLGLFLKMCTFKL